MRDLLLLLLTITAPAAAGEVAFEPSPDTFADAAACKAHLAMLAGSVRPLPQITQWWDSIFGGTEPSNSPPRNAEVTR